MVAILVSFWMFGLLDKIPFEIWTICILTYLNANMSGFLIPTANRIFKILVHVENTLFTPLNLWILQSWDQLKYIFFRVKYSLHNINYAVGIWNPDMSWFWMVDLFPFFKRSGFWMVLLWDHSVWSGHVLKDAA